LGNLGEKKSGKLKKMRGCFQGGAEGVCEEKELLKLKRSCVAL